MKSGIVLTVIGIALLAMAWVWAAGIPKAANRDFDRLVSNAGGQMSHTPNFPDAYKQMSANRRMLQNFYLGAAGLICLAAGLASVKKEGGQGGTGVSPRPQ